MLEISSLENWLAVILFNQAEEDRQTIELELKQIPAKQEKVCNIRQ